jgi:hypothetical protein
MPDASSTSDPIHDPRAEVAAILTAIGMLAADVGSGEMSPEDAEDNAREMLAIARSWVAG